MSQIPQPSPISHLIDDVEETAPVRLEPTLISALPSAPAVLPLTDFELDVRRRLANIESHIARSDGLIMALQVDQRQQVRALSAQVDARFGELQAGIHELTKSIGELAPMLRTLAGNGRDPHA